MSGQEPTVVSATADQSPPGIDISLVADLAFPGGLVAQVRCAMNASPDPNGVHDYRRSAVFELKGDNGMLRAENPVQPYLGNQIVFTDANGYISVEQAPMSTTYEHQLRAFASAVAGETAPMTGGTDAINNMRLIDEIYLAAGMSPRGTTAPD
jgi:predicted dehydrogenase